MEATELRINSKNFPPPVAEAFNRLGLPDRIVIKDLRIVFRYIEALVEIESISNTGGPR